MDTDGVSLLDVISGMVEQDEVILLVNHGKGLNIVFRKDFDNNGTVIASYYAGELLSA